MFQEDHAAERTSVPAAARAFALIETFARERRELTKSEIARLLDVPESSCSDLLNTLYTLGYVGRSSLSKRYYPTGRLLDMATLIDENDPLRMFGSEATALLSRRANETCTFGVLDGSRVKIVAVHQGSQRLRYVVNAGDRVSLHGTAIGKALMSILSPIDRSRELRLNPLRKLTGKTITDPNVLETEIESGLADGYFASREEGGDGVWSFAVGATFGSTPVGFSIIGPAERMRSREEEIVATLIECRTIVFEDKLDAAPSVPKRRGRPRRIAI